MPPSSVLNPTPVWRPFATQSNSYSYAENRFQRYDPDVLSERFEGQRSLVWKRSLSVVWPFFTWLVSWSLLHLQLLLWHGAPAEVAQSKQRALAKNLRRITARLGPTFIKVGQAMSSRGDLLSRPYIDELSKLQDQIPTFKNGHLYLRAELGRPLTEMFAELSEAPVAAASLGQVYRGRLKTGEDVAVKVQRPGLETQIALDLYIVRSMAVFFTRNGIIGRRFDVLGMLDEFAARLYEEMDYLLEASNAERFYRLYGHTADIKVPRIFWPFCTRHVLTMEWVSGIKLTDLAAIREAGLSVAHLLDVGVQCSLRQLLEHGFMHCDPHPGNLLATRDGRLAYLDFGMMSEVAPYQRYGLISATVHLVNEDYEALAHDCIALDFAPKGTEHILVPALRTAFQNQHSQSSTQLNFGDIAEQVGNVIYAQKMRVPRTYILILRSLGTLEGIAVTSDSQFKVVSRAYPFIARRLLADPAPELKTALRDLLFFPDGSMRWSRVETLLHSSLAAVATSSSRSPASHMLHSLEFLLSDRAAFVREYVAEQAADVLDEWWTHSPPRDTAAGPRTSPAVGYSVWRARFAKLLDVIISSLPRRSKSVPLNIELSAPFAAAHVLLSRQARAVALEMWASTVLHLCRRLALRSNPSASPASPARHHPPSSSPPPQQTRTTNSRREAM